ncbi:MAG: hypothetical protein ACLRMJ_05795 [Alistipes finegoldii]
MTSYLTVGQIFRNTSLLLLAPIVTALVALPDRGVCCCRSMRALRCWGHLAAGDSVAEPPRSEARGIADCFRLWKTDRAALHAGRGVFHRRDVGSDSSVRLIDNPDSILTTTGFYACRIVGTLVGAWVLVRLRREIPAWNMTGALASAPALLCVRNGGLRRRGSAGFAMACVSRRSTPWRPRPFRNANEVAGLMILAISAGPFRDPSAGDCPLERRCALGMLSSPCAWATCSGRLQLKIKIKTENDDSQIVVTLCLFAPSAAAQRPAPG